MFGTDGLRIPDGGQVEFLIPVEQFTLVRDESHHLSPREMDVKEFLRVKNKFLHSEKIITPLP